jgi:hypothetical protein
MVLGLEVFYLMGCAFAGTSHGYLQSRRPLRGLPEAT